MTYKPVRAHDKLREKALSDPETRALYDAYKIQIDLAMQLKKARMKRKMTQENVAEIMHTKKPAISRLESGGDDIKHFPSLLTLTRFASATGHKLTIGLTPIKGLQKPKQKTERHK